ncbi:MAG: hypothetical protein PHT92_07735 [Bacteroidales bacterium]|nr:hypothetical protein [Bacteroidales bacterium]
MSKKRLTNLINRHVSQPAPLIDFSKWNDSDLNKILGILDHIDRKPKGLPEQDKRLIKELQCKYVKNPTD